LFSYWWGRRKVTVEVRKVIKDDPLEGMYEGLVEGKPYHQLIKEKVE
jgi:hypothetical protein